MDRSVLFKPILRNLKSVGQKCPFTDRSVLFFLRKTEVSFSKFLGYRSVLFPRDISIFSWYVLPWRVPGEKIFLLNFSLSSKCNSKLLPAYVLPVGKMSSYKIFWNVKNIPAGVLPKKVQVEVFPCRPPTNGQNVRQKNMSKCQLLFCCDKRVNGQGISSGIWFGNRVNGQGISSGIW